jgi:hypothetical protein
VNATNSSSDSGREGRIRAALGLGAGLLPKVEDRWLSLYYHFLAVNLQMPFAAQYAGDIGRASQLTVTVVALVEPDDASIASGDGLACRAEIDKQQLELPLVEIEVDPGHANFQLLDDYWFWFWNWRFDPGI